MKKAREVNINELATKKELAKGLSGLGSEIRSEMSKGFDSFGKEIRTEMRRGFEDMAGMMSRSFDKLNETIGDFRSDMQAEFKIVKGDIKDVQGRVGNIEVALRQDQNRIAALERKQGVI